MKQTSHGRYTVASATKKKKPNIFVTILAGIGSMLAIAVCVPILVVLIGTLVLSAGNQSGTGSASAAGMAIMDKFDMAVTNEISKALDGIITIEKSYWLDDEVLVAPEAVYDHFGTADSPAELAWLLEETAELVGDQELIFNMDTPVWEHDKIYYYYDETILALAWKQKIEGCIFTIAEIKVKDASQFRRFLAGGEFGSDKQFVTTEMAASVNAIVATSGDFYKFRQNGIVVYDGKVQRFEGKWIDTCFIDNKGDLILSYRKQFSNKDEAQAFVDENNIRFSLVFGPVLVDNYQATVTTGYPLGEVFDKYTRAAVCQLGDLHYAFANVTTEPNFGFLRRMTINEFAQALAGLGIQKAYALDGGQTTVICMQDQLISYPDYGTQRKISDIIYFATAMQAGG